MLVAELLCQQQVTNMYHLVEPSGNVSTHEKQSTRNVTSSAIKVNKHESALMHQNGTNPPSFEHFIKSSTLDNLHFKLIFNCNLKYKYILLFLFI